MIISEGVTKEYEEFKSSVSELEEKLNAANERILVFEKDKSTPLSRVVCSFLVLFNENSLRTLSISLSHIFSFLE